MGIRNSAKNHFLKEWVGFNFLGLLLGAILGPILFYFLINPEISYVLEAKLEPVFFSFPFGIGLGIMQQMKLRRWDISPATWTLATIAGIGIPITFLSWYLPNSPFRYYDELILASAEAIVTGLSIGVLQAVLIRRLISKPGLWILVHVFGVIAIGAVALGIIIGAYLAAEPIEEFLYALGLWIFVEFRYEMLTLFVTITLPVSAALFIALPTGMILQKFSNIKLVSEDKGNELSSEKLAAQ